MSEDKMIKLILFHSSVFIVLFWAVGLAAHYTPFNITSKCSQE